MTLRGLEERFADYAQHHQTGGNKWCHRIGIPLIMLSLLGMLARVPIWRVEVFRLDVAMVLIVLAAIYYLRLEPRLGALMVLIAVLFYLAGARLPLWLNIALLVGGWILQFVGHAAFEHRQPAFLRNLAHLLVGPLWLLDSLISAGRRKSPRVA